MSRWVAILCGGAGTRFWPASTPTRPKQLLNLAGDRPLLRQAADRVIGWTPPERVLVLTGADLLDATRALLPEIPADNFLAEPRPASTGPALAWATHVARSRDPDATLLSIHADWYVGDDEAFRGAAADAVAAAETHDALVTVGITPDRPEIGYGYIEPGAALDGTARRVERFTEKPDAATAAGLIAAGALWNSGMFAWPADRFFRETAAHAPEIEDALDALDAGDVERYFATVTPIAVDHSHYERSDRVVVVAGRFPWDDIGTWAALARVHPHDADDNVLLGSAFQRDAAGCVVWAEDGTVVVDGVSDLVVVSARSITLVTTRDRAAYLKELLATLPDSLRHP